MISPEINTEIVKDFLRAVYKAKKREIKKKRYRRNISGHIGKIKKITLSKKFDKRTIEQEFKRLEEKIDTALEKQILEGPDNLVIQLKNRLDKVESELKKEKGKRESLNQIKLALQRIHEEVRHGKRKRIKRRKREKELERKIRS